MRLFWAHFHSKEKETNLVLTSPPDGRKLKRISSERGAVFREKNPSGVLGVNLRANPPSGVVEAEHGVVALRAVREW